MTIAIGNIKGIRAYGDPAAISNILSLTFLLEFLLPDFLARIGIIGRDIGHRIYGL